MGIAVVVGLVVYALSSVAGILPYLLVAGVTVLILNPVVKAFGRLGLHRRTAATVVFGTVAIAIPPLLAFVIQAIVDQGRSLVNQAPGLVGQGGVFARFARSNNGILHSIGTNVLDFIHRHQVGTAQILDKVGSAATAIARYSGWPTRSARLSSVSTLRLSYTIGGPATLWRATPTM